MNKFRAQREDQRLEREARLHFADFVDKRVSENVLDGSALEFKDSFDSFVYELRLHMLKLAQ